MEYDADLIDDIARIIDSRSDRQRIELHNDYCDYIRSDYKIWNMTAFDFVAMDLYKLSPMQIVESTADYFDPSDRYFVVDDDEIFRSFDDIRSEYSPIDSFDMARISVEDGVTWGIPEIADLL